MINLNKDLKNSWELTKINLNILKNNKELLFFPIISGIFTFAFTGIMIILFILNYIQKKELTFIDYFIFFLFYLGNYLIINFFNACLIYSTKNTFNNKKINISESIKNSLIITKRIFFWTLFSSTIGLLLDLIDSICKRIGKGGKTILNTMEYLLGLTWGILSKLVFPIIIYYNLSPIKSTKKSINLIKNTWGKKIINYTGISLAQFYITFIIISLIFLLYIIVYLLFGNIILIPVFILGLILLIYITMAFNTSRQLTNIILFLYASNQNIPKEYNKNKLKKFFK
jgi:hypothetical protein